MLILMESGMRLVGRISGYYQEINGGIVMEMEVTQYLIGNISMDIGTILMKMDG